MSFQDRAQHTISQLDKEVFQPPLRCISFSLLHLRQSIKFRFLLLGGSLLTSTCTCQKKTLQLSKYPMINNFEKQTSVPKVYAFLGLAGVYFFLIFFNIGSQFLVNTAGFVIPAYYSLDALFSASKVDDTQVSLVPFSLPLLSITIFSKKHQLLTQLATVVDG